MRVERKYILPVDCPQPVSYYSHGMHIGNVMYSAGQTSRDSSGQLVGIGNVEIQASRAYKNLSLVLADAGMSFQDVVRLKYFSEIHIGFTNHIAHYGTEFHRPPPGAYHCIGKRVGISRIFIGS